MEYGIILGILHQVVGLLLYPVAVALMVAILATLWEVGQAISERLFTLNAFVNSADKLTSAQCFNRSRAAIEHKFQAFATKRLERADLLARSGPILGLMGTLIPLGPGLTALGSGNIDILATALTVAFDTTVVGLLVGLLAFVVARIRRRWYEGCWQQMQMTLESAAAQQIHAVHPLDSAAHKQSVQSHEPLAAAVNE